jgi:hypothetical protein
MALDAYAITHPGQINATGDINANAIEEYTGIVENTIARKSVLQGFVPMRTVKGTDTITSFGVGESTLQAVVPGTTPDGTVNKFGKRSLSIDTLILARDIFPLLEVFQTSYDARKEVGTEHGKKIAKFWDQSMFIQAIKSAQQTNPLYGFTSGGWAGGTQVTMTGASDHLDPAKLYAYVNDLFTGMEQKDVDPRTDDVLLALQPREFNTLLQNEQLINTDYMTSEGVSVKMHVLKAYGAPVVSSNNLPAFATISGHLLSNSGNSNAYDGDFTKVVAVAFAPKALLAGETIPLTTAVFWDEKSKLWFVDAHLSFGVTPNRPDYAGVISAP